jgi:hypothetical protein
MKRQSVGLAALLILVVAATGCDQLIGVRGSGNVITESRDVSGFSEVAVLGSGVVIVDVNGTESLVIEAEDNIMPLLSTEVRGETLELGAEESISPTVEVRYTISAAALDGVSISGSGNITATNIDSKTFAARIDGSGYIEPAGNTGALDVEISGSGEYSGAGLVAQTGEVTVSGSGDAVVNATDALEVTISGSGSVEYLGNPSLSTSISGSGNISQR